MKINFSNFHKIYCQNIDGANDEFISSFCNRYFQKSLLYQKYRNSVENSYFIHNKCSDKSFATFTK